MPVKVNVLGNWLYIKFLRAPRFKKGFTLWPGPPWAKTREYTSAIEARPNLKRVTSVFAKIASMTKGMPLHQRMRVIREAMKGASFGGAKRVVYPPKSEAEINELIARAKAVVTGT